jgi:hypothetical protein
LLGFVLSSEDPPSIDDEDDDLYESEDSDFDEYGAGDFR